MGTPFDGARRSPPFQSSVGRFHFAAKAKRGAVSREDCFVLASDARREQVIRADFVNQLSHRAAHQVFNPPSQRLMSAPGL